jgi:3-hydroxyacyl-CoA dehydrogenase
VASSRWAAVTLRDKGGAIEIKKITAIGADLMRHGIVQIFALNEFRFALCPSETILATNTSVISITEIVVNTKHKSRVVGTHFWNPSYPIPPVEVIRGDHTADQVIDSTMDLLKCLGQAPQAKEEPRTMTLSPLKTGKN